MKYTLKMLRAKKNLTQAEAAEAVGVKQSVWCIWERYGEEDLQKIADVFGVKAKDIVVSRKGE